MKNARAKRAKILFFIVKYANLRGICCRRRRGCLFNYNNNLSPPLPLSPIPYRDNASANQKLHKKQGLLIYLHTGELRANFQRKRPQKGTNGFRRLAKY